jgi:hypothetical protein
MKKIVFNVLFFLLGFCVCPAVGMSYAFQHEGDHQAAAVDTTKRDSVRLNYLLPQYFPVNVSGTVHDHISPFWQPNAGLSLLTGLKKEVNGSANPVKSFNTLTSGFRTTAFDNRIFGGIKLKNFSEFNLQSVDPSKKLKDAKGLVSEKLKSTNRFTKSIDDASKRLLSKFESINASRFSANLSLENNFRYSPVTGLLGPSKFNIVTGVRGNIIMLGIPLNVSISNNQAAFDQKDLISRNLMKFGLNPEMFSGLVKNQLQQYGDLKNSVFHGFDFSQYVGQTIKEKVSSLQREADAGKTGFLSAYLGDAEKLKSLIRLSPGDLKSKLANVAIQDPPHFSGPDSIIALGQWKARNLAKADSIEKVITAMKSGLAKKGVDPQKLLLEENYLTGKTSTAFNNSELLSALRQHNPSGTMQSLLSNLQDLKVGSFGSKVPGATDNEGRLVNGGNVVVKLNRNPFTLGFGKLNEVSSLKDAAYTNSIYSNTQNITYVSGDIRHGFFGTGKFSIVSSFATPQSYGQMANPALPGNAVTLTLTKYINLYSLGKVAVDISRSTNLNNTNYQNRGEAILQTKAGINATSLTNDLFQSAAFGLTHDLSIRQIGLTDNVYFNYGGFGYKNPANNGNSGSVIKYGGNFKKSFYSNRLNLNVRTDFREMPLTYINNDKWKNHQIQFISRYKFNNHLNLSLKYLAGGTAKVIGGVSNSVYSSQKLEMDMNTSYKIGKQFSMTHVTIGQQGLQNQYASAFSSNMLNLNILQTIAFKKSALTATVYYNKEVSAYHLIGDLITSDISYQYQLFKKVQVSSGVTYLNNGTIAKQAGLRQSIQVFGGKHFDVNASMDLRKNLVPPQYADLYAAARGELSLKYYLKTN